MPTFLQDFCEHLTESQDNCCKITYYRNLTHTIINALFYYSTVMAQYRMIGKSVQLC